MTTFDQWFPTVNPTTCFGCIRTQPEDFQVSEINDLAFTEQGEHWWLFVEKVNSNTAWAASQIASACKVPAKQVGYAGLKDRHAVTRQWFSVQLPKIRDLAVVKGKLPKELSVIDSHWHQSKIKRGQLKANQFTLRIRNFTGDQSQIEENIKAIRKRGVPNYFGPQRFGHDMGNIDKARSWFAGDIKVNNKNQRSLYISTARSHIFNQIIAHRLENQIWDQVLEGDIIQLSGSHSWFHERDAEQVELVTRLAKFDVHITAALWGEDAVQSNLMCADMEGKIANEHPIYIKGLKQHRVKQDRRAVRLVPMNLEHQWVDGDLLITMKLGPGSYATSVLREVLNVTDASANKNGNSAIN